ncbi:baseplate J/gp47 family protein [Bordetella sp. LUAb4]|uniref:baseplate J/gp47 family protein n=1 Tax=Bordetella sp. LUAb4 TaxID=2843195 RepID=UPI001E2946E0|nr:baseplate J/gp47 family protein [Bordetella sp. LUAb4]
MATRVPAIQWTPQGLVLPAESSILDGVQADQDAAFGGGMNRALETPQGQLATSTTAIIGRKNDEIASIVNQVNPVFAEGRMQDAIGYIYFLERKPGTPTAVVATCMGLAGTIIPVGAQAKATDGSIYLCTQQGTIPASGSVDLAFACSTNGPIACPVGQLNQIYQSITGWDSVLNAEDGTPGSNVESRAEFEDRRRQSVALNAVNSLQSIYANVLNVAGVIDAYAAENVTAAPITIGNVTLAPHSIWIAVFGGAVEDIAHAIWRKKSLGANYNGNTSYEVQDKTGYAYPYPTYRVTWQTAQALPIKFAVEIANDPALPADIVPLTRQAIIDAFDGADGGVRARIGATLFASRYYAPVVALANNVSILSLLIGPDTATLASYTVPIDSRPTINANDITVKLV